MKPLHAYLAGDTPRTADEIWHDLELTKLPADLPQTRAALGDELRELVRTGRAVLEDGRYSWVPERVDKPKQERTLF